MDNILGILKFIVENEILLSLVKIGIVLAAIFGIFPFIVLYERKLIGWMQQRPGPNRVGPWGLLQCIVDGVKLFLKEEFVPPQGDKVLFFLAPILVIAPAFINLSIIPFGPEIELFGHKVAMTISDVDLGILFILAVAGLGVYGITLAGFSSNNKYSLLGGLRASAQLISYELALSLSIIGVLMLVGDLNLRHIADSQKGGIFYWHIFKQPLGFLLLLIAGFAETNRLPFDLPEAEPELTGGYHTEYSSMKFAMFFMGEYINMIIMSCLIATFFLGGYHGPFDLGILPAWLGGPFWMFVKVAVFITLFIWIRGTLPRFRFDQLMSFGWKVMLPIAVGNLFITAIMMILAFPWWLMGLVGLTALIIMEEISSRVRRDQMRFLYGEGTKIVPFSQT